METPNVSQTQRILNYLLNGGRLTAIDALKKFNCLRLASRINEISQTHKVTREMIVTKSKKRIARYAINL